MKRYVALFVSLLLVFSGRPAVAGFLDTLKGLMPGHHQEHKPEATHHAHRARPNGSKGDQPAGSPSPDADTSPGPEQSPGPSPTVVESPGPSLENNQSAEGDLSTKPASSPVALQNSVAQTAPVEIDPPPLF
jgi:hypothetical protein